MTLPALALAGLALCGPRFDRGAEQHLPAVRWHTGRASWVGDEESVTSTGAAWHPQGYGCAHRTLPIGARLELRWRGRVERVAVADRGPFHRDRRGRYDRELDASEGTARRMGWREAGVVTLRWRILP